MKPTVRVAQIFFFELNTMFEAMISFILTFLSFFISIKNLFFFPVNGRKKNNKLMPYSSFSKPS